MTKVNYPIIIVLSIGMLVLYFFPEPESNFLAYIGTIFVFIMLIIFVILWQKKKKA